MERSNTLKHLLLSLAFLLTLLPAVAQVGFNNPNPHPSSLIDMTANDKGLLVPRVTTIDRTNMAAKNPAHALLVFDKDQNMFFVYDTIANPDRWVALNPFQSLSNTSDIITSSTGNVGIGAPVPLAKLHVNGTIYSSNTITTPAAVNAGSVNVNGAVNASAINGTTITATQFIGSGSIPKGGIIMWSGAPGTIPNGWALCDGSNGTPNLANRFVLSYGSGSGAVGSTGGTNSVTLTVANLPPHQHNFNDKYAREANSASGSSATRANTSDNFSGITENGANNGLASQPFDNRPAYYVLAFIMML